MCSCTFNMRVNDHCCATFLFKMNCMQVISTQVSACGKHLWKLRTKIYYNSYLSFHERGLCPYGFVEKNTQQHVLLHDD